MNRRSEWQRVAHERRHQLAAIHGWVCEYCLEGLHCGQCDTHDDYEPTTGPSRSIATADHIFPLSAGGDDSLSNLVLACASCNSSKGVDPKLTIADEMGWNL